MNTRTLNVGSPAWQVVDRGPVFPSMGALMEAAGQLGAGLPGSSNFAAHSVPKAAPPEGMSISVLPTGVLMSRAALAFSGGRFDDIRRFALNALLVRHPQGDLLFDTGMGSQWREHREALPWIMRRTTRVEPGRPAVAQLREHG